MDRLYPVVEYTQPWKVKRGKQSKDLETFKDFQVAIKFLACSFTTSSNSYDNSAFPSAQTMIRRIPYGGNHTKDDTKFELSEYTTKDTTMSFNPSHAAHIHNLHRIFVRFRITAMETICSI